MAAKCTHIVYTIKLQYKYSKIYLKIRNKYKKETFIKQKIRFCRYKKRNNKIIEKKNIRNIEIRWHTEVKR